MNIIQTQCSNCKGHVKIDADNEFTFCKFCGAKLYAKDFVAPTKVITTNVHKKTITLTNNQRGLIIFGSVVLILVLTIILYSVLKKPSPPPDPLPSNVYKAAGVYHVGEDIPADEYILYPSSTESDAPAEFQVRKTKEISLEKSDFLYSKEFHGRQYVILNEGEYIEFSNSYLYKRSSAKLKTLSEGGTTAHQLKVGEDIPAGEYIIQSFDKSVYYMVMDIPQLSYAQGLNSPHTRIHQSMEYRLYVTVYDGEYLYKPNGKLYSLDFPPPLDKTDNGEFIPGQYKIGTDIPYGTYRITPVGTKGHNYTLIKNSSKITFPDKALIVEETKVEETETKTLTIKKSDYENDELYLTLSGVTLKVVR